MMSKPPSPPPAFLPKCAGRPRQPPDGHGAAAAGVRDEQCGWRHPLGDAAGASPPQKWLQPHPAQQAAGSAPSSDEHPNFHLLLPDAKYRTIYIGIVSPKQASLSLRHIGMCVHWARSVPKDSRIGESVVQRLRWRQNHFSYGPINVYRSEPRASLRYTCTWPASR